MEWASSIYCCEYWIFSAYTKVSTVNGQTHRIYIYSEHLLPNIPIKAYSVYLYRAPSLYRRSTTTVYEYRWHYSIMSSCHFTTCHFTTSSLAMVQPRHKKERSKNIYIQYSSSSSPSTALPSLYTYYVRVYIFRSEYGYWIQARVFYCLSGWRYATPEDFAPTIRYAIQSRHPPAWCLYIVPTTSSSHHQTSPNTWSITLTNNSLARDTVQSLQEATLSSQHPPHACDSAYSNNSVYWTFWPPKNRKNTLE